jgi:hypothetical protein
MTVRQAVLNLWTAAQLSKTVPKGFRKLKDAAVLLSYGCKICCRRRRVPVDVPAAIESWKAVIVLLCTAHGKDELDAAEFRLDELLTPMLTAPVAQLREFYAGLLAALERDPRVPFFVWSMFRVWGEAVVDQAEPSASVTRLRRKLAGEIAAMVDEEVKPDLATAIRNALMWRPPEALKEMKASLEAGAKPKLKGRESCLFLTTSTGRGRSYRERSTVML